MITIDTNVFAAALIRDSATRKLLLSLDSLCSPYALLEELEEHCDEFQRKSGLSNEEYDNLIALLLSNVSIIGREELVPYGALAKEILKDIDPDDESFIACALATKSVLWSDDAVLKRQRAVRVVNTKELVRLFAQR